VAVANLERFDLQVLKKRKQRLAKLKLGIPHNNYNHPRDILC